MIQDKHLMVGNKVYDRGQIKTVEAINGNAVLLNGQWKNNGDNVDPIPLTPEILEKCGFEYEGISTLTKDGFPVYFKKKGAALQAFVHYLDKPIKVPCEYVHQLQNLVYILTGEELNVEL